MLEGKITKNISNSYTVNCGFSSFVCTPRGKFRKKFLTPLVGDNCLIDEKNNYIMELLPRKNELKRPHVCNVDVALIITSLKSPDYNSLLLDKEITSIILAKIKPIICFTKIDLLKKEELPKYEKIKKYYQNIGIAAYSNQELPKIIKELQGKTVVLTGQSGAGKSTLLNKLDPDLNLNTKEISKALNRGVHTTRHTEIFEIMGISFFDTPGFSSLTFDDTPKEKIKECFQEFQNFSCKFQDCNHLKETFCGVKEGVEEGQILPSRYESYQKIWEECQK